MLKKLFRDHLHAILYSYFWLGLFVGGLVAPEKRVLDLESDWLIQGSQLTFLSLILVLPAPIIYILRMRQASDEGEEG